MGITSSSLAARAVPLVRRALAGRTLDDCHQLARRVLAAPTADEARAAAAT